jgi:hypothetical protein
MGWTAKEFGFNSQKRCDFSLLYNIQTGSGAHLASGLVGSGGKEVGA